MTKRDLVLLSSALSVMDQKWAWVTDDWDVTRAKLSQLYSRLSDDGYVCPPGGNGDYTLISDDTLLVDTASYTLDDLDLLSGVDLVIELEAATSNSSPRSLNAQINGLTTSIYKRQYIRWISSATYYSDTSTKAEMPTALTRKETPMLYWAECFIHIPNYKLTTRYPVLIGHAYANGRHTRGWTSVKSLVAVDEITLYPSAGNFLAGTRIKLFTKG